MNKTILTLFLLLAQTFVIAECRKDTIYESTKEDGIEFKEKRIINQFSIGTKIIETIVQNWNTSTLKYDNFKKTTFTYHSSGVIQEQLEQVWNVNTWRNNYKSTGTFNGNGKRILYLSQSWDNATSAWKDNSKTIYNYDANNNVISYYNYSWNYYGNNIWDILYKDSLVYDVNNRKIKHFSSSWDKTINNWEYLSLNLSTYNSNGKLEIFTEIDWFLNKWDSSYRTIYTYNSKNQVIEEFVKKWDQNLGLINLSKKTLLYNSSDNLTEAKQQIWNPSLNVWENYNLDVLTYLNNTDLIKKSSFLSWSESKNAYTLELIEDYKCSFLSSIKSINGNNIKIYPNPNSSNFIHVSMPQISNYKLFDAFGKQLCSGDLTEGINSIEILGYNNGIYFIKIDDVFHPFSVQK